jgi:hypothetical protein
VIRLQRQREASATAGDVGQLGAGVHRCREIADDGEPKSGAAGAVVDRST